MCVEGSGEINDMKQPEEFSAMMMMMMGGGVDRTGASQSPLLKSIIFNCPPLLVRNHQ